jgi:hypothetical protein
MQVRSLSGFVVLLAIALLLAPVVGAQGAPGVDPLPAAPPIAHADPARETLTFGGVASPPRCPQTTSGGGSRAYLPFVARNYDPLRLYFDSFGDESSGWPITDNDQRRGAYLGGEYQILLKWTDWGWLVTPDLVLPSDYRIEVDARQVGSNASSYGVMFAIHSTADSYEGYQVIVYPASQLYLLEKRNLDASWPLLIDWTYSSAIHAGTAANHLRVDRIGTLIYFYVNGTLVTTFADSTFTGAGRDAGIRAYSYESAPVDVRFDNFGAYRIP